MKNAIKYLCAALLTLLFVSGCYKAPVKLEAYYETGYAYTENQDYEKAIETFQKVLELGTDSVNAYAAMGYVYLIKQDYDKAIECYQKAIELKADWNSHLFLGDIYNYNKQDYDKAIEHYKKVIELEPDAILVYSFLVQSYGKKQDYDKAIEYYDKAIDLSPSDLAWWAHYEMAEVYFYHKKDYDKAIEYYEKTVELDSGSAYIYINIGWIYGEKKNYDKAIEYYQKAIKLESPSVKTYNSIGWAYGKKQDYDKAIEYYQKAIEIKPDFIEAYRNLERAYYYKRDYDKSIEWCKKLIELEPDKASPYHTMGRLYAKKKDYDKAIEYYEKALELKSDLAIHSLGNAYAGKKDYGKAIEYYKKAIEYYKKEIKFEIMLKDFLEYILEDVYHDMNIAHEAKGDKIVFDPRDGKKYKTVKIGTQIWMAENLNYGASDSKCYDNDSANCEKYGRLYDWNTAKDVCPKGWRLPNYADWNVLYHFADSTTGYHGNGPVAGRTLKAKSDKGLDTYGFSALLGGYGYPDGSFSGIGSYGSWWTSSISGENVYGQDMYLDQNYARWTINSMFRLYSVRCLRISSMERLWE